MSEKSKERKCMSCGKKLLDEKVPFCLRCRLEGRNTTAKVVGTVGAVATVVVSGAKVVKDNIDK